MRRPHLEQHVHNLDVINWAMKAHPIQATGMGGAAATGAVGDPKEVGHIFDHFAVDYEYPNGVDRPELLPADRRATTSNVSEAFVGTKGRSATSGSTSINGKRSLERRTATPARTCRSTPT